MTTLRLISILLLTALPNVSRSEEAANVFAEKWYAVSQTRKAVYVEYLVSPNTKQELVVKRWAELKDQIASGKADSTTLKRIEFVGEEADKIGQQWSTATRGILNCTH